MEAPGTSQAQDPPCEPLCPGPVTYSVRFCRCFPHSTQSKLEGTEHGPWGKMPLFILPPGEKSTPQGCSGTPFSTPQRPLSVLFYVMVTAVGKGPEECRAFWKTVEDRGKANPSPLQPVTGREKARAGLAGLHYRPRLCDSFELMSLLCLPPQAPSQGLRGCSGASLAPGDMSSPVRASPFSQMSQREGCH